MLIESLQGRYPSYFVYGPLVFSTVSREFCAAIDRPGSPVSAALAIMGSPLVTRRGDRPAFEGEELVVVTSPMFPHAIAKGYDNPLSKVVKEINGVPVKNLRHFVELLRDTKAEVHHHRLRRPLLRDHRLRPQGGPQGDRGDPLRQRHPPAGLRRPDGGLEEEAVGRRDATGVRGTSGASSLTHVH